MTPPTYLVVGDVMELGIDQLGTQRRRLTAGDWVHALAFVTDSLSVSVRVRGLDPLGPL